jgi:hypothetical protein
MQFQCATVTESDLSFVVVKVKPTIIEDPARAEEALHFFATRFPGKATVLMTESNFGRLGSFYGRRDIAMRLAHRQLAYLNWTPLSIS